MYTRTDHEAAADRERAELDARRRGERFASLGQPRPVMVVDAGPRPDWVQPLIPPPAPRAPRPRAPTSAPRAKSHRPAPAAGKCSICRTRDVKPPREMRGRNAGKIKIHKTCQPCIDERMESKRKRAAPAVAA